MFFYYHILFSHDSGQYTTLVIQVSVVLLFY